jgi:hypothetical protein
MSCYVDRKSEFKEKKHPAFHGHLASSPIKSSLAYDPEINAGAVAAHGGCRDRQAAWRPSGAPGRQ